MRVAPSDMHAAMEARSLLRLRAALGSAAWPTQIALGEKSLLSLKTLQSRSHSCSLPKTSVENMNQKSYLSLVSYKFSLEMSPFDAAGFKNRFSSGSRQHHYCKLQKSSTVVNES